jgi:hypothetical protein
MIRYRYNTQHTPPAPFMMVTIRTDDGGQEAGEFPARVDTGADRTIVPSAVVEALEVRECRSIVVEGMGGDLHTLPTFLVQVELRRLTPLVVEVGAHPDEPFILLGRDVLNHFRLILDGPLQTLEIS